MQRLSRLTTAGALFCLSGLVGCGGSGGGGGGGQNAAADESGQMAESGAMAEDAMAEDAMAEEAMAEEQQAAQQQEASQQDEALIAQGREIFAGAGLCYACHGNDGKGIPGLGANLTDDEWLQSDGSLEGILKTVMDGVPAEKSSTGTPMPPKGGSSITDDQVNAVAAFVLSLSGGDK